MPTPDASHNPLDALIVEYLEAVERGEHPDRVQWMTEHSQQAAELAQFFADLDKVEATRLHAKPTLDATVIPQHEPKPGTIMGGRYKLLENIGEGGMGSVWVAEQKEPVKRKVAIKLIKAGMDSKQVLARFEAERQALAVMDHPNIAKVFDGGNGRARSTVFRDGIRQRSPPHRILRQSSPVIEGSPQPVYPRLPGRSARPS